MTSSAPTTFHRRPLPSIAIPFSSPEGRAVFREALAEGGLESYFHLSEQLHTQADPAFCGLGSLVTVLNALGIDPGRTWKGPWRWFAEDLLDCCTPLDEVRRGGISLDIAACLARCNGAEVEVRRATDGSPAAFRSALRAAARAASGPFLIASYSRAALGQTGDGHFSPLGGYCERHDLALILDVARFKYPPHWVPVPLLWEAMRHSDPVTGLPRGYLLLQRGAPEALEPASS